MLPHVHEHIVQELRQSARTDTVFVVVAVAFNLIALGINWGTAQTYDPGPGLERARPLANDLILVVLLLSTVLITGVALRALRAGMDTRQRLTEGLVRMYEDEGVARYYDPVLAANYAARYRLFAVVVGLLGALAVVVPLIERFLG
ncbi:MAG TPA: hypothetical protein VK002_03505 [Rubricoccaceae bacterium]|nr:hypothetical protein [Rubricoccaceae bacterium]